METSLARTLGLKFDSNKLLLVNSPCTKPIVEASQCAFGPSQEGPRRILNKDRPKNTFGIGAPPTLEFCFTLNS